MRIIANLLILTTLAASISACLPVALVGVGAATGTMLSRDSRSLQTISDDTDIQFQVDQAIKKDKALHDQANISNIAFNHIVLLVGQAPSEQLRMQAEQLTQKVAKVRRVYNQIQIAPNIGALQMANDVTISTNLKARIAVTSNVNSNDFKYIVENKVVYLMGLTDKAQLQRVTEVIRNSSGVKKLVTLVEIEHGNSSADDVSSPDTAPPPTVNTSAAVNTPPAATSGATADPAVTTGGAGNTDVSFQPVQAS